MKAVQGNGTPPMLHHFSHSRAWILRRQTRTKFKPTEALLLELTIPQLGPICLTFIYYLYNTVRFIQAYCSKHTKAKVTREKK